MVRTFLGFYPLLFFLALPAAAAAETRLETIQLPPGFSISLFASAPGARSLASGVRGTVFAGSLDEGKVYALIPENGGASASVVVLASGLTMPNGVAVLDGDLYVSEINRILRFPAIEDNLRSPPQPIVVSDTYPEDRQHGWKFIAFGPDRLLYVPIGAPCNICERQDPYASISTLDPRTGAVKIFARGIRNTVGFDWHPATKELWFTDNGRDRLGDERPPDELNRAERAELHFGYPYCFGAREKDPEFRHGKDCSQFRGSVLDIPAHAAALGMRFYTGTMFPQDYRNQVFIAEHGSWNRSTPIGYRISLVKLTASRAESYSVFASGWLQDDGKAWGRPVDVLVMKDGSLLISDDRAGAVYRITYAHLS